MRTTLYKGIVLGAVVSMLVLVASTAVAGTGIGGIFNLGQSNTVDATSSLSGASTGAQLQVTNTGTGTAAQGIAAFNNSAAATLYGRNSGTGPGVSGRADKKNNGVEGVSAGAGASGVYGANTSTNGYGVAGRSTGASGIGVFGNNTGGGWSGWFATKVHLGGPLDCSGCVSAGNITGKVNDSDLLDGLDSSAFWKLTGNAGTDPATNFLGTSDNQPLNLRVNGKGALRIEPGGIGWADSPNLIGGFAANTVAAGKSGATIGGGGGSGFPNTVFGSFGTVAGGDTNTAGPGSTVSGGETNTASGSGSSIAGGSVNSASGEFASVAGGHNNSASGPSSLAAGNGAQANDAGSFVWADSDYHAFPSSGLNTFNVRSTGGARFVTAVDGAGTPTATVSMPVEGGIVATGTVNIGVHTSSTGNDGIDTGTSAGTLANRKSGIFSHYNGCKDCGWAGYFGGDVNVTGTLSKGGGSFKIDDPLDPAHKYLQHSFVESPDMMNVYNGNVTTDAHGFSTVQLPRYFQALNRTFRYQLTVMGHSFAQAIVWKEIQGNRFTIRTNRSHVKVSWQVTGVRHDAFANAHRIPTETSKIGKENGRYLHPELFGQPQTKGITALFGK